ncbi:MAG: alpha-galactosidase [Armatimonadetes bacterium]|nr:alpha-galactosidase [Armatimonadota bacterium]
MGSQASVDSDEFLLRLGDRTELTTKDFRIVRQSRQKLPRGGEALVFLLRCDQPGLEVRLEYEPGALNFFLRKRLAVRSLTGREALLRDVEVERFRTSAKPDLGGYGQPLYLDDSLFFGLEYPAGYDECRDGLTTLGHHPGRKLTQEFMECKSAVFGVSPAGKVEEWFQRYVSSVRLAPRFFLLYNSWYDIQRGTMSTENFIKSYHGFKENLTDRHGVKLDAFVPDDGWQDHRSIWEIDKSIFPEGFKPLAEELQKGGTRFGLWMPLTPVSGNLDIKWGSEHGYETDTGVGHYCLSAPRYNAQLREVLRRYATDYNMNYFKHDFNAFECHAEGHGHLPESLYGTETNVDAYLALLDYLRSLKSDMFLNITSNIWLSPWWLSHANTVWMGGRGDWAYEKGLPALEPRDWELNARDADLFTDFHTQRAQFPSSSLMYHGIVDGRYARIGGEHEPLEKWTDNVVMHLGRGVTMVELYLTPSLINDRQWELLAQALKWAKVRKETLFDTRLVLGNAGKGEVCGYVHRSRDRLLVCVRNPVLMRQLAKVRLTEDLGLETSDKRTWDVQILYPYRRIVVRGLRPGGSFPLELSGNEVCLMEVVPKGGEPDGGISLEGCRYRVAASGGKLVECELLGLPGTSCKVSLTSPKGTGETRLDGKRVGSAELRVAFGGEAEPVSVEELKPNTEGEVAFAYRLAIPTAVTEPAKLILLGQEMSPGVELPVVKVNDKAESGHVIAGDGWKARVVSLASGSHAVRWSFPLEKVSKQPFQRRRIRTSCWLNLKRSLVSRRLTLSGSFRPEQVKSPLLPTPFADVQNETIPVQPLQLVNLAEEIKPVVLSAEDLKSITAAKLHFTVFGSEGGPYEKKPVLLNGKEIGTLPLNDSPQDRWQERVLDLPKNLLSSLRLKNGIVLTNPTGDCFKIKDLALAVQLPEGNWVETGYGAGVYCSVGDWLHGEGTAFVEGRSRVIEIRFPER